MKKIILLFLAFAILLTSCTSNSTTSSVAKVSAVISSNSISFTSSDTTIVKTSSVLNSQTTSINSTASITNYPKGSKSLTANDLKKFESFLNINKDGLDPNIPGDFENNKFIMCYYHKPQDIDLSIIFYNGCPEDADIAKKDYDALEKQPDYYDGYFFGDVRKITTAVANKYLEEKVGLDISQINTKIPYIYSKSMDAYYSNTNDGTPFIYVTCISGYISKSGLYVVQYVDKYGTNGQKYQVTLKAKDNGYQFVSNEPLSQ